jgi:coiled-coil domain-containing protein 130
MECISVDNASRGWHAVRYKRAKFVVVEATSVYMSSLAAARADNFYRPPPESGVPGDGSNAAGKRAKGSKNKGVQVVRFEMPFDVWCGGCDSSIAQGVRFNAEKCRVGNYFSSTIWGFRMKAPCCKRVIEIHTNPKETDYDVVSGARRKASTMIHEKEGEGDIRDGDAGGDMGGKRGSGIAKLERSMMKERAIFEQRQDLERLKEISYDRYGEDVEKNRELRRSMRNARNEMRKRERRRDELGLSKEVALLPETALDRLRASAVVFQSRSRASTAKRRRDIMSTSIFGGEKRTG